MLAKTTATEPCVAEQVRAGAVAAYVRVACILRRSVAECNNSGAAACYAKQVVTFLFLLFSFLLCAYIMNLKPIN